MKRIAFVTDLHIRDERIEEHEAALSRIAKDIREQGCKILILGGDLSGVRVPHLARPSERNALLQFIEDCEVEVSLAIRGNHDTREDWDCLFYAGTPWVSTPTIAPVKGGLSIGLLPWIDRPPKGDWKEVFQREFDKLAEPGQCNLIVAHAAVAGGAIRLGQPDVPTKDPIIDVSNARCPVLLGHYHAPQLVKGSTTAAYGGSAFLNEYGEEGDRGWTMLTLGGPDPLIEHRPVPQVRRWVVDLDPSKKKVASVRPEPSKPLVGGSIKDALCHIEGPVRVCIPAATPALAAAAREAVARMQTDFGDRISARIEVESSVAMRDGAEEVATATSLPEKLVAFSDSLPVPPRPETLERAVEILSDGGPDFGSGT